ncbi:MAG TPA: DUF6327 family protein [Flavobacterium sp.]|nr:DUF6327 family protein [Flavobacterium sp.]
MKHIKYTSIKQIDTELKSLKISNGIQYQKLMETGGEVKDSFQLTAIVPEIAREALGILSKGAKGFALQFILKKIFRR